MYMARVSKIEKYGLQDKILKLKNNGKSLNDIVKIVKKEDNVKLSPMAVKRWLDKHEEKIEEKAIEVIREDKRRVVKSINQTYDIIQTQLDVSQRVLNKLNDIDSISEIVKKVTETAVYMMQDMGIKITPEEFALNIEKSISRNIKDYTLLTKEVRENNKFLADLKEKIYDFSLLQEFVLLFIEKFKEKDPETTLKVLREIKADKRLRRIIESSEGDEQP